MKELICGLAQNIEYDSLLLQFYVFMFTWMDCIRIISWTN